jgi:hypothetical protein
LRRGNLPKGNIRYNGNRAILCIMISVFWHSYWYGY